MSLIVIITVLSLILAVAWLAAGMQFNRQIRYCRTAVASAQLPMDASARLPRKLREFALRADATPDDLARSVSLTQDAEMRLKPAGAWQQMSARQSVAVGAAGFAWVACQRIGPMPKLRVADLFVGGAGALRVQLLGAITVAHQRGADINRAQAMRYLAELPWVPDAILGNPAIGWRMIDLNWAEAALELPDGRVAVRYRFDAAGDIVEVFAADRPASDPSGAPTTYDWRGYFRDYRRIGSRRVPAEAEVGYIYPEGYRAYFQCRITGYWASHE